ncbi:MAG: EVE domain-containing protein [Gammaproteobacteria bacterium]
MNYWLMKSEPDVFSIEDLANRPRQTEHWDGVRNYQVRNMLRDQMKPGDLALFYHSSCKQPAVVGVMRVVKAAYPDPSAFDPHSKYYDPGSTPQNPRWYMVDVQFVRRLKREIPLHELKNYTSLADMALLKRGNRLSIMPLSKKHWDFILKQENKPPSTR